MTKLCRICGLNKPFDEFGIDKDSLDGRRYLCKSCRSKKERVAYLKGFDKHKVRQKRYRDANRAEIRKKNLEYYRSHKEDYRRRKRSNSAKEYDRRYREAHKEELREYNRRYGQKHKERIRDAHREYERANKLMLTKARKAWYLKNHDSIRMRKRQWARKKRKESVEFRLLHCLRNRLRSVVKGNYKSARTMTLVGCSIGDLKAHPERLFRDGMSWDNHGKYGWHIDHILPCASFDMSKEEEQKRCFHFSNLQPLWARENLSKRAKVA